MFFLLKNIGSIRTENNDAVERQTTSKISLEQFLLIQKSKANV